MLVFGHRGYSARYPENTILAFEKAFEYGADGVELDVRGSKDGHVVVFHDEDLRRLFKEDSKVKDLNADHLKNLGIPELEDVLRVVPNGKWLIVEIKDADVSKESVRIVKENGDIERTIFSSFDHGILEDLRAEFGEDIKLAMLIGEEHKNMSMEEFSRRLNIIRPHSVHVPKDAYTMFPDMTLELLKMLKGAGIGVFLWNINDLETYRELEEFLDAVITDEVELFVNARDGNTR